MLQRVKGVFVNVGGRLNGDIVNASPTNKIGHFEYKVGNLQDDFERWADLNGRIPFTDEDLNSFFDDYSSSLPKMPNSEDIDSPYQQTKYDAVIKLRDNMAKDYSFATSLQSTETCNKPSLGTDDCSI